MESSLAWVATSLVLFLACPSWGQGYINPPIYATGKVFVPGGSSVGTQVLNAVNPNNLNILANGPIASWTVTLPFPTFDGQLISVGCPGGTVTSLSVTAKSPDIVLPSGVTSCTAGTGEAVTYQYQASTSALPYGSWVPIYITGAGGITVGTSSITSCPSNGYLLYNNNGVAGCTAPTAASLAIGSAITGSTNGFGLYVASNSLAQFAYGSGVFTALGNPAGAAGGFATYSSLGSLAFLSSINNSNWSGSALSIGNGGTGTSSPGLIAGSNVTISGSWPNQTIAASGGSSSITAGSTSTSGFTGASIFYNSSGVVSGVAAPSSGQLLVGSASSVPTFVSLSGDCTLSASGVATCLKVNGVAFGPIATESVITQAQGGGIYPAASSGGAANAITVTTQSGSFTNSGSINGVVIFTAPSTNTGPTTLSADGQTPLSLYKRTTSGPIALAGGEINGGLQYLVINSGSSFELISEVLGVTEFQSGNYTATAVDGNGDSYIFTGTVPVLTLPHSTTVPISWHIQIYAQNALVSVNLANSSDSINGILNSTITVPKGNFSTIFTDANGNYYVSGTSSFVNTGGTGLLSYYISTALLGQATGLYYDGNNTLRVGQSPQEGILTITGPATFSTSFTTSASATAAATYTLPPAKAAGSGYVLTDAAGNGVLSWAPGGGTISFPLTVTGTTTSGGIPYFSSTTALSSSGLLAANSLVVGGGAGSAPSTTTTGTGVLSALGLAVNSASGFPLVNSTLPTVGHCLQWGSNGVTDAGGACTTGGGGGTVSSGNAGQLAYYASTGTTVAGLTSGTSGQFLVESAAPVPTFVTMSSDCTLVASGAITCTKTSGVAFSSLATLIPGTGVTTALGTNVGSAGAFVTFNGALGTPSSGTATNLTGLPAATGIASGALPSGVTINNSNWSGTGLALGNLATQAANTVLGNATASSAVPTALAIPSCSTGLSALQWTTSTGFACNTSITASAVPATGVTAGALGSSVTINNANWSGTGLAVSNGGTGQTSALTQYGSIYASTTSAMASSAAGITGQVLVATTSAAPTFGSVPINGSTLSTGSTGASLNLGSANTWTGTQTFSGTSSTFGSILANAAEPTTVGGAISSPLAYYFNSQSVYFSTTAQTANWTVNFAFSSGTSLNSALATGQTVTAVLCALQGSTAYYNSAVQIDGVALTTGTNLFWQGGTAPSGGNASGYDCYSYTILKTGSATYIVLATQTQF